MSAKGAKLDAFIKLVCDNPPAYKTDWKYGGAMLLCYAEGQNDYDDGCGMLNGVECRVWRHKRLGMHSQGYNSQKLTLPRLILSRGWGGQDGPPFHRPRTILVRGIYSFR